MPEYLFEAPLVGAFFCALYRRLHGGIELPQVLARWSALTNKRPSNFPTVLDHLPPRPSRWFHHPADVDGKTAS